MKRSLFLIFVIAGVVACDHTPPTTLPKPPTQSHGIVPDSMDSLHFNQESMWHATRAWGAPTEPNLVIYDAVLRQGDAATRTGQPRAFWPLRDTATKDLLNLTVLRSSSFSENGLRALGEERLEAARKKGWLVTEHVFEWRDGVREYRQFARDTVAGIDQVLRCVSSYGIRPNDPMLVCANAWGKTAATTLNKTVMGLTIMPFVLGQPAHYRGDQSEIRIADGMATNAAMRFSFPIPATYVPDPRLQKGLDMIPAVVARAKAYVDTLTQDHITVSMYGDGQWQIDSLWWASHAENAVKKSLDGLPGSELAGKSVQWTPAMATYRIVIHDVRRGQYQKSVCKGSSAGRPKSVVVCVNVVTPELGRGDDVLDGLILATPSDGWKAR